MNFLTRRAHGILDYAVGLLLIGAPLLLGFNHGGAESRVPQLLGVSAIIYSLITNYELGAIKILPFKVHLTLDVLNGLFLAASPWIFGFKDQVWVPHVVLGLFEIGAVMATRTRVSEHMLS